MRTDFEKAPHHFGCIEVICGPMFSGKTEELIRRTRRAEFARLRIQVFKPTIDDRYASSDIISHNQLAYAATSVKNTDELSSLVKPNTDVIAIDEIQFFPLDVVPFCIEMANDGKRVIVAGLDLDYQSTPFEVTSQLLAQAEYIEKLSAICVKCGQSASRSFRLASQSQQILVGAAEAYEARCRSCYYDGRLQNDS